MPSRILVGIVQDRFIEEVCWHVVMEFKS
jgi:hypothetical protein